MTFGIPVNKLPLTVKDDLKLDDHIKWLEKQKVREEEINKGRSFMGIDVPSSADVLLGRGRGTQSHPGNLLLRQIILSKRGGYQDTYRGEKQAMAARIVELVQKSSGRFLIQYPNGWWYEVSDDVARKKVSHGLRGKERPVSFKSFTRNKET